MGMLKFIFNLIQLVHTASSRGEIPDNLQSRSYQHPSAQFNRRQQAPNFPSSRFSRFSADSSNSNQDSYMQSFYQGSVAPNSSDQVSDWHRRDYAELIINKIGDFDVDNISVTISQKDQDGNPNQYQFSFNKENIDGHSSLLANH